MRHPRAKLSVIDSREECEREHLLSLWMLADFTPVCFISLDLEGSPNLLGSWQVVNTYQQAITELGLVSQRKNEPRKGRHFVVQSTQGTKSWPPLPAGFGMVSENVVTAQHLYGILEDFFHRCWIENRRVVLTGFAIKGDLEWIVKHCGWVPPTEIPILDTATIFKTFVKGRNNPSLARALRLLDYDAPESSAPFHNAANDAWYTLELLEREAAQALKQLTSPGEEDSIEWLPRPPQPPPSSPTRGTSTKSDYDDSLSIPTIEKRSKESSRDRQIYRKRSRSESASLSISNAVAVPAATPTNTSPPAKKIKMAHESETTEYAEGGYQKEDP